MASSITRNKARTMASVTSFPGAFNVRSMRERVSPEEWDLRVNLAACYRLMARYGMTDLIYNHITVRVPGPEHHILINAYGMLYEEVTASSLIKVDLAGNIIDKSNHDYSVNAAGYIIHSAVHEARADAQCIIHTHTRAGVAVSGLKEGLMPLSQTAMRFHGRLAYHDYEGPAFDRGEKERLVSDLGEHSAMILRNHGLLVCGPSIPQTFFLENACRIQVDMLACQRPLNHPSEAVTERTAEALSGAEITLDNEEATNPNLRRDAQKSGSGYGLLEWPSLLRSLDRADPSYRD
jgi:ribulose-5-phosphate 4-epimerase/fuculose-1-phosphate aldolase